MRYSKIIQATLLSSFLLSPLHAAKTIKLGVVYNKGTYNHGGSHGNVRSEFMQGYSKTKKMFKDSDTGAKISLAWYGYSSDSGIGSGSSFSSAFNKIYSKRGSNDTKYTVYRTSGSQTKHRRRTLNGFRDNYKLDFIMFVTGHGSTNFFQSDGTLGKAYYKHWYSAVRHGYVDENVQGHEFGHNFGADHWRRKKLRKGKWTVMRSTFSSSKLINRFSNRSQYSSSYGWFGSGSKSNKHRISSYASTAQNFK